LSGTGWISILLFVYIRSRPPLFIVRWWC
jgi:hypothetical protein